MAVRQQNSPPPPERNGTIIGPAIEIRGTISGEEYLRIQGRIEGNISLSETLVVEPTGIVLATIRARDVVISGIVIGDVYAGDSVSLDAGAKLVGNITAPRIIVADGAAFRGRVDMSGNPPSERSRSAAQAAARGLVSTRPSTASASRSGSSRAATSTASSSSSSSARGNSARGSGGGRGASASNTGDARSRGASNRGATTASRNRGGARTSGGDDGDVTAVVRHESLRKGQEPAKVQESSAMAPRKKAQKIARPRVPNRGKRRVERQS